MCARFIPILGPLSIALINDLFLSAFDPVFVFAAELSGFSAFSPCGPDKMDVASFIQERFNDLAIANEAISPLGILRPCLMAFSAEGVFKILQYRASNLLEYKVSSAPHSNCFFLV